MPYNAARDGCSSGRSAALHPKHHFPHVVLLVMGVITAIGSFFDLATVIRCCWRSFVFVQGIAQIVALTVLRRRQPGLRRPYKQWLYPMPSLLALAGWIWVYCSSGTTPIIFSLVVLAAGIVAFGLWARAEREWPFGTSPIREEFLVPRGAAAD